LSVGMLLKGDARFTLLGKGYIVVQALTVMILAELQYYCVRGKGAARLVPAGTKGQP
jgi:hypothetical protein